MMKIFSALLFGLLVCLCGGVVAQKRTRGTSQTSNLKTLIGQIESNSTLTNALIADINAYDSNLAQQYLLKNVDGQQSVKNYEQLFGCSNIPSNALVNFFNKTIVVTFPHLKNQIQREISALVAFNERVMTNKTVMNRFIGELIENNYDSFVSGCIATGLSVDFNGVRQSVEARGVLNGFYADGAKIGKGTFLCNGNQ